MDQDPLSEVRIAKTPSQAKLFVAMLQGAGIRAYVEGGSLADEVAVSRSLMNVHGTHVKVRTEDLERAREVLTDVAIDERELEAQALAVDASEAEMAPVPTSAPVSRWVWVLLGGLAGALLVWMLRDVLAEVDAQARSSPFHRLESHSWGLRESLRADPAYYRDLFDDNGDGFYERIEEHTPTGALVTRDRDGDGRYDEYKRRETSGVTETWIDTDGSGHFDAATIKDKDGNVVQRMRWIPGSGYELTPR